MKRLSTCLIATVLLATPATAVAQSSHQYALKPHHHCAAHYVERHKRVKVKKHGRFVHKTKTFCVRVPVKKVAPKATVPAVVPSSPAVVTPAASVAPSAPVTVLRAHIDPSFTQNPENGLEVSYSYSASAQTITDQVAVEAPSLPNGVLLLYNQGVLACSMNVGGNETGGECAVSYPHFGTYNVEVIYVSGESSATSGPETETIAPTTFETETVERHEREQREAKERVEHEEQQAHEKHEQEEREAHEQHELELHEKITTAQATATQLKTEISNDEASLQSVQVEDETHYHETVSIFEEAQSLGDWNLNSSNCQTFQPERCVQFHEEYEHANAEWKASNAEYAALRETLVTLNAELASVESEIATLESEED
jgi:Ni/Co efflux regulator RcnB